MTSVYIVKENVWRHVFAVLSIFLMMFLFLPQCSAKTDNKIEYVRTETVNEAGRDVLRIELGMASDKVKYTVSTKPYLKKQVIVNLSGTRLGKVKEQINPESPLVKMIHFEEPSNQRSVVTVDMTGQVLRSSYKVYTLPADAKNKKPCRVIIDIKQPRAGGDEGTVDAKGRTVIIDPGHGGSDTGAIGASGSTEKSVCLAVSKKVKASLAKNYGIKAVMTRENDRDVHSPDATASQELQARVNVQLRNPSAAAFVSIHCNAFTNPSTYGTETYYFGSSGDGARLAGNIQREMLNLGGLADRGVKTANFYVLKHTTVPSSLVELAFITNPHEEAMLNDDYFQSRLADAIAKAISKFLTGR